MGKPAKAAALIEIARAVAKEDPAFQTVKGPGHGDHSTAAYIKRVRQRALSRFGADHSEKKICGPTSYAVDFYFEEEATIVEIALGLPNPSTEFEKDILKA